MAIVRVGLEARDNISNQLKRFRVEAGMSQSELAAKTGMTVQTIVNIEKGHSNYGIDRILQILDVLDRDLKIPVG